MSIDSYRCPKCRTEIPVAKLRRIRRPGGRGLSGGLRCCPACGYVGFARAFSAAGAPISYAAMN
jgi:ssDNA-binding Zn-finger/Zn-ribbon topoisomerase 1